MSLLPSSIFEPANICQLIDVLLNFFHILTDYLFFFAALFLVIGGIFFLLFPENPLWVKRGRLAIISVVAGLMVIYLAEPGLKLFFQVIAPQYKLIPECPIAINYPPLPPPKPLPTPSVWIPPPYIPPGPIPPGTCGGQILLAASKYRGRCYESGDGHGNGCGDGLDCSGFVSCVMKDVGIFSSGMSLSAQDFPKYPKYFSLITREQLQPGDLIVSNPQTQPHIVIFAGWAKDGRYLVWESGGGDSHSDCPLTNSCNCPWCSGSCVRYAYRQQRRPVEIYLRPICH
jgi:hypothetical protein